MEFFSNHVYDNIIHVIMDKYEFCNKKQIFVGFAGSPGSGKTTLTRNVCNYMNNSYDRFRKKCMVVPMDGYHYYKKELESFDDPTSAMDRRGAPFTFNSSKFVNDLRNAKINRCGSFPSFDHSIGDPIENEIVLDETIDIVLLEGNYLLLNTEPWNECINLFELSFYIKYIDEQIIINRLCGRHMSAWNISEEDALCRIMNSDIHNARLINGIRNGSEKCDYFIDINSGELSKNDEKQ